jgi:tetratricopeptide (TPR) repeat protein
MLHATVLFTGLLFAWVGDAPDSSHDIKTYEALKAKAGRDSQAQVKLALWCEAYGLNAERVKHLALAVLSDPKNVTARGLLGLVASGGRWETAERARERIEADDALRAKLAEYEQRRSKLTADEIRSQQAADRLEESGEYNAAYSARLKSNRRLAPAHAELGRWCESQGLKPEATAHFTMAVHLDPYRDLSWKHLGYVKRNGRWTSRDQAAAEEREVREQKQADRSWEPLLKKWTSMLGDRRHREEAEGLLATVTDRRAVPSILKLFPIDRPEADQLLRVSLLGQVDDPSSSRAIVDQAVWTRFDSVRRAAIKILKKRPPRDYAGKLVEMIHGTIRYHVQPVSGPNTRGALVIEAPRFRMLRTYDVPNAFELAPTFRGYVGYDDNGLPVVAQGVELDYMKRQGGNPLAVAAKVREIEVRTANMLAQATQAAQRQMAEDIYTIDMANDQARAENASIVPILKSAAGASEGLGNDEDAWRAWWFDTLGYSYQAAPKPTFTQGVVPEYLPYSVRTCFAAGTPVHTRSGARSIEAIQVGDQVLSQDGATGALSFQSVVFVHRNPPAKTLRIKLSDGEYVVCSVYHRFWRANLGWAQARELKPGDSLRSLGGIVRVDSIGPDSVQPLYNLDVASSRTFFAGYTTLLVHDNTLPDHRLKPFDALPVVEVTPRPE